MDWKYTHNQYKILHNLHQWDLELILNIIVIIKIHLYTYYLIYLVKPKTCNIILVFLIIIINVSQLPQ